MSKYAYIEQEIVLINQLKKGDLFCPATDCLEEVFWQSSKDLSDIHSYYKVPDLEVFEFIQLSSMGDVECKKIFPAEKGWHSFNTGRRHEEPRGNALDFRFRRVTISTT